MDTVGMALLEAVQHHMGADSVTYKWVKNQLDSGVDAHALAEALKNELRKAGQNSTVIEV